MRDNLTFEVERAGEALEPRRSLRGPVIALLVPSVALVLLWAVWVWWHLR